MDTSVWIDHLRAGDAELAALLEQGAVLTHPFVVGEIACGTLAKRRAILVLLQDLPMAAVAEADEVLGFIERHTLHGRGIGYVDVHLLASAAMNSTKLWTRDKRLRVVAGDLRCTYQETDLH